MEGFDAPSQLSSPFWSTVAEAAEKPLGFFTVGRPSHGWQGVEQFTPVGALGEAGIEDRHHPLVSRLPDQASGGLG